MRADDLQIQNYYRIVKGYLPILNLQIHQTPFELGDSEQSVRIELVDEKNLSRLVIHFTGLADLQIANIHPNSQCMLDIFSIADRQLEGIRYRVFNGEQDLTLCFYCQDFTVNKIPI